ncbi:MAG TPA: DinB family protein [Gemmatimonadales bacterium]|nr:DinB family protein [Gemmatimonadales bacterium]
MLPALARDLERLEARRRVLLARVRALTPGQRTFRPAPDRWSVLDVVEHLVLVDEAASGAVRGPAGGAPRPAAGRLRYLGLLAVLRSPIRVRVPTRAVLPSGGADLAGLEARWVEARAALAEWLEGLGPEMVRRPVFRHPVVGWLTVRQTLGFLGAHQAHHEAQVRRIERAPGFR